MGRWGYNKEEQDFDSLDLIPSSPPPTNISEAMHISQNAPLHLSSLRLFALCPLAPRKGKFVGDEHTCFLFHFSLILPNPEENSIISYRISFYEYFHLELSNSHYYYSVKSISTKIRTKKFLLNV